MKLSYGRFTNTIATHSLSFLNKNLQYSGRIYSWVGGVDPDDAQLEDPSSWEFLFEQSAEGMHYEIDPDLRPDKTSKFLLEFDRQPWKYWAFKVRGIYSYSRNLMEDVALYDPETLVRYLFTNFELKKRDYKALEVELSGRIAGKFMLNASYTSS